jgi:hypothetical protein
MIWVEHVVRLEKQVNVYRTFVGKPRGKKSLGRPRLMWVDNTKMDIREIGLYGLDLTDLTEDRVK